MKEYKGPYRRLWEFHEKYNKNPDFDAIVREIGQMETDFQKEMSWAIASEIERRFIERQA